MASEALNSLERERYISLETFRKNGTGVRTPIWFAHLDGSMVAVTNKNSYKVKRLRKNSAIKVAACNMNGKKILGPFHDGSAEVVEDAEFEKKSLALLKKKYRLQWGIFSVLARLGGTRGDWIVLRMRIE